MLSSSYVPTSNHHVHQLYNRDPASSFQSCRCSQSPYKRASSSSHIFASLLRHSSALDAFPKTPTVNNKLHTS